MYKNKHKSNLRQAGRFLLAPVLGGIFRDITSRVRFTLGLIELADNNSCHVIAQMYRKAKQQSGTKVSVVFSG